MAKAQTISRPRKRFRAEALFFLLPVIGVGAVIYVAKTRVVMPEMNLAEAVLRRDEEAVRSHLALGTNPNDLYDDHTPLFHAISRGNNEIIKMLIDSGARADVDPIEGDTPLLEAVRQGDVDLVKTLVDRGGDINDRSPLNEAPLELAANAGKPELVAYLLEIGAKPNEKVQSRPSPLHEAAGNGHLSVIDLLLKHGADIEIKHGFDGETPLLTAITAKHPEAAETLLQAGADPKALDRRGRSALHLAVAEDEHDLVRLLIEKGADIHRPGMQGRQPIHTATLASDTAMVKLLLEKGADANALDGVGNTPLMHALAQEEPKDMATLLLNAGARLDVTNSFGINMLHLAASGKMGADFFKQALAATDDVNAVTVDGETATSIASDTNQAALLAMLIKAGGKTPELKSTATGAIAVVSKARSRLLLLDAETGRTIRSIRVGREAHEMVIMPDEKTAVVANYGNGRGETVSVIDLRTAKQISRITVRDYEGLHGIEQLDDERVVVTSQNPAGIHVVNIRSNEVERSIRLEKKQPHMMALSKKAGVAFVSCNGERGGVVIRLSDGEKLATFEGGGRPEGIALTPDGKEVWLTCTTSNEIFIVDAETYKVKEKLNVPGGPIRVEFTPDGRHALVSLVQSSEIGVMTVNDRKEIKRIPIQRQSGENPMQNLRGAVPLAIHMDPYRPVAYVSLVGINEVVTIRLSDWTIQARFKTAPMPDGLAVTRVLAR